MDQQGGNIRAWATGDFNRDGKVDFVVVGAETGGSSVALYSSMLEQVDLVQALLHRGNSSAMILGL